MSPRHLFTRHPLARKQHQCWECTRPIEPGTLYRVDLTAYEGRTYSIKAHVECADAGMALATEMDIQDEGRDRLIEEITASGEPLDAFDLPDVVRRRLEDAIAEGEARDEARRAEALGRMGELADASQKAATLIAKARGQ
jgi:hypothetical protein